MAISDVISGTVAEFIEFALLIVGVMIIYYIIRLITFSAKGEEEAGEERKRAGVKKIGAWKRENKIRLSKSYILKSIESGEDLVSALHKGKTPSLRNAAAKLAGKEHKKLLDNLDDAAVSFRRLRQKEHGDAYRFFHELYAECGNALRLAEEIEIPDGSDPDWSRKVSSIETEITGNMGINHICSSILESLTQFVESEEAEEDSRGPPSGPYGH